MGILQDIAAEGALHVDITAEQQTLADELRQQLNHDQRRLLRRIQDVALGAGEETAQDNYCRGFCAGLCFAEGVLRSVRRF